MMGPHHWGSGRRYVRLQGRPETAYSDVHRWFASGGDSGRNDEEKKKRDGRDRKLKSEGGGGGGRIDSFGVEETVGGWPKWLTMVGGIPLDEHSSSAAVEILPLVDDDVDLV
ncbi:unnamed protein product [Linum trigynum]|uniref:Uncharacterized protein n=1 Tax=Linum trigynum TaxID=586398 RepID=A0AAV2FB63_9ROSI